MNISKFEQNCTGCGTCALVCPNKAITMQKNKEGFLYPRIDTNLCSDCSGCEIFCHLNKDFGEIEKQTCYVAKAEKEINDKSSSGGLFSTLAQNFLKIHKQEGFICACAFDKNYSARHITVNKIEDIEKLKGSKYIQSELSDSFLKIKNLLDNNKHVLFCATPCQCAALRTFLKKDYQNLFIIDILCHGVPSPEAFKKYLKENYKGKILDINFRYKNKDSYLKQLILKVKTNKEEVITPTNTDAFMQAFSNNLINRKSCSSCKYTNYKRTGDITLGDFWKIDSYIQNLNPFEGISMVLINNKKGEELFSKIKNELSYFKKVPKEIAKEGNKVLSEPFLEHKNREIFFQNADTITFQKNVDYCLKDIADIGIINLWYTYNYGAALTSYALQKTLEKLHYSAKIIDNTPEKYKERQKEFYKGFEKKYLNLTENCTLESDYIKLNDKFNTFITGSDQVFRVDYNPYNYPEYFLNFANIDKRKIALAASFGQDYLNINHDTKEKIKTLLSDFNFVSTREKTGVELCKRYFNKKSYHLIDPVFMLDVEEYQKIALNSKKDYKNKIITYILDKHEVCEKLFDKTNKICHIKPFCDSIEDFLNAFINADFIITDSYHGVCFSLIFNKPFLCIINKSRGGARFKTLYDLINTKTPFVDSLENIDNINLNQQLNYKKINKRIKKFKKYSLSKLKKALKKKKKLNKKNLLKYLHINSLNNIKRLEAIENLKKENNNQKLELEKMKEMSLYFKLMNDKKKVLLWGASLYIQDFIKKYNIKNDNIIGFIDRNPDKHNSTLEGYKVFAPEKLKELQFDKILITIINYTCKDSVLKYLEENNIKTIVEEI